MDVDWIKQRAKGREESLAKGFEAFSSNWSMADRADCFMNRGLLLHTCEAYFADIARLKGFHGIENADSHKRAGYTVKWIMRFRPVQYRSYYVSGIRIQLANESFALWIACEHLGIDISSLPDQLVQHTLYHFRFRPFEPDSWAVAFFLMQQLYTRSA